jgi:hypothetical protein
MLRPLIPGGQMGPEQPNLRSIQNPGSSQEWFEHRCAAQLHTKQAREPGRYIFALQPFQYRVGFGARPIKDFAHTSIKRGGQAGNHRSSLAHLLDARLPSIPVPTSCSMKQPSILLILTIDASGPAMLQYLLPCNHEFLFRRDFCNLFLVKIHVGRHSLRG